ncbi:MAG: lysophospholipid acyltransferase family protein [Vicinamibacteria bacterium]|jgi:KDO2-lipid IV(A) lauroyltransferase|nr:lysophospholipid acyltransferase family protein [Vicinamibacteria bacterium]
MSRRLRFAFEAAALGAFKVLAVVTPRPVFLRLGRALGALVASLDRKHRDIAKDNLRRSFPDWSEDRVDGTARGVWIHFGGVMFDLVRILARGPEVVDALVTIEGAENATLAHRSPHGVVLITGHFGNWETHGIIHAKHFGSIGVVARPLDNPTLDRAMTALRESAGNEVIEKEHAMIRCMRRLKAALGVAFVVDQNVQEKEGIFVNFFGRPACTTPFAAKLALKTGALVLPCRAVMTPDLRYRVIYDPPIDPRDFGAGDEAVVALTQAMMNTTEAWIRANPDQWLWMHRRWHTQPPGSRSTSVGGGGA